MKREQMSELIRRLRDFRTRSAALAGIVAAGEEAVAPLAAALEEEKHEGAKWAIIHCLGELGSRSAVEPLIPHLEDVKFQTAVHEALMRITGLDLGPAPHGWRRWLESVREGETGQPAESFLAGDLEPGAEPEQLPDERLVELALKTTPGTWRETEEGNYQIEVNLQGAGQQKVWLSFNLKDHEGSPIVIVYSDCGPADPAHYEDVLKRNLRMPYGAIAIREMRTAARFVMFNTLLREALSPIELKKSIFTVGERAGHILRALSK